MDQWGAMFVKGCGYGNLGHVVNNETVVESGDCSKTAGGPKRNAANFPTIIETASAEEEMSKFLCQNVRELGVKADMISEPQVSMIK